MKNNKHTQGQWTVTNGMPYIMSGMKEIAKINCDIQNNFELESAEIEANAKLIAAAPELLSALAECLSYLPTKHNVQKKAIEAINKATH